MGRKIALGEDFDGPGLRRLAKASKDAGQSRRLLALAEIYDGAQRTDAVRLGDVGIQVVRDWVLRFNAKGPAGLIDGKATGKPRKLNNAQRRALARIVESGPIPAIHGVVRWRRKDLAHENPGIPPYRVGLTAGIKRLAQDRRGDLPLTEVTIPPAKQHEQLPDRSSFARALGMLFKATQVGM